MQIKNEIFSCYTTPAHVFQLGIMGYWYGTIYNDIQWKFSKPM